MNETKLNELALGYASAIICTITILLFSIFGKLGIYMSGVEMMQKWHLLFSLSITGIIGGMIESAIIGFIFAYAFGFIYNKFVK